MIIYFSATGNSRYAAHLLADQLNEPITDAGAWIKNNQKGEFYSETPWVFVSPTYSWQMRISLPTLSAKHVFWTTRKLILY